MKKGVFVFLLFSSVLICFNLVLAQERNSGMPDKAGQRTEVKFDQSKVSPEFRKILETQEKGLTRIGELEQRMKTSDGNQMAELQKEVEKIKKETQLEIFKIRLNIARGKNDARNIQEIEKAINQAQKPLPVSEDLKSKTARENWEKENGVK